MPIFVRADEGTPGGEKVQVLFGHGDLVLIGTVDGFGAQGLAIFEDANCESKDLDKEYGDKDLSSLDRKLIHLQFNSPLDVNKLINALSRLRREMEKGEGNVE